MPLRFKRRLLDHLQHRSYTPRKLEDLARDLGIDDAEGDDFAQAIDDMADEGTLEITDNGLVRLPSVGQQGGEVEGTFKRNPKGFGFVSTDDPMHEGDLYIAAELTGEALTGDRVRVRILRDKRFKGGGAGIGGAGGRSPYVGEIIEVLERKRAQFTGELRKQGAQWLCFPDGRELHDPIIVRDAESKNAKVGDKIVIELVEYPSSGPMGTAMLGEGVVVRVLGKSGEPDVETQAVIAAFGLPGEFPAACVDDARAAAAQFDAEIKALREAPRDADRQMQPDGESLARLDLTDDFIITIDPPDAKDYDDAISIRRTDDGWELGVHIADVAHFIDPGSALDEEAKERGNSVYLPRLVIPMLPEVLSNGICSLQEAVPRFCKSSFMNYDRRGNIRGEGVASTLIKSAKRLTYLEAQALIDGNREEAKRHAKTEPNYTDQLVHTLREMDALAKAIQKRRHDQGMISLELPDVVLIFDENGRVIDAEREDDAFTHTLIEMFMVEANEVLARLFEKVNVPLLRRVHPEPTPGNVDDMRKAAKVAGFVIPPNPTREQLQSLLDATRGTPAARAVHMAVLRTLTRAEYSPALVGHFALASAAYAHFTSPIRRYADLTVHRALAEYLRRTDNGRRRPRSDGDLIRLGKVLVESPNCPDEPTLVLIGRHITVTEENAEDAERQLRQFLVLQLLAQHVGESFKGVVTGVNQRGVFVQIDKYLADGMIKVADLPGDVTRSNAPPMWKVDQRTGALVDQRSGRSFNMGDTVMVKIAQVDLARRQMDLVLGDDASRAAGKVKKPVEGLQLDGGMASGGGMGFKGMTGEQRRSRKSKSRDKGKKQHRRDK
ncbi:MAG: ribonuclease R family protein [Phycisphaerales bacterium]